RKGIILLEGMGFFKSFARFWLIGLFRSDFLFFFFFFFFPFVREELVEADEENKRIYFYYLALANYRLGEFVTSRKYTELLLRFEPKNRQARALKALLDEQVHKGSHSPTFPLNINSLSLPLAI